MGVYTAAPGLGSVKQWKHRWIKGCSIWPISLRLVSMSTQHMGMGCIQDTSHTSSVHHLFLKVIVSNRNAISVFWEVAGVAPWASAVLSVVSTMPDADDQTLESADAASSLFVRHATTIADAKVRNWEWFPIMCCPIINLWYVLELQLAVQGDTSSRTKSHWCESCVLL